MTRRSMPHQAWELSFSRSQQRAAPGFFERCPPRNRATSAKALQNLTFVFSYANFLPDAHQADTQSMSTTNSNATIKYEAKIAGAAPAPIPLATY